MDCLVRDLLNACQNCWLWILLRRWIWLVFLPLPLVAKIQHQWIAQHRCQQPAYEDPECLINETVHQFLETSPAMFRTWFRRTKHYGSSVSYFRSASLTRNTTDLEHRTKKHVSSSLTKQRDKSQIHMRSPKLYRGVLMDGALHRSALPRPHTRPRSRKAEPRLSNRTTAT